MTKSPQKARDTYIKIQENDLDGKSNGSQLIFGLIFNVTIWLTLGYYLIVGSEAEFLLLIMYLLYLIEALFSPTFKYLCNLDSVEDIVSYINRLKTYPPVISFYCESYHYETRTRRVTEYENVYNSSSNQYESKPVQKTETYQEKIVTYKDSEDFNFLYFEDVSGNVNENIYKFKAIKVDFSKYWEAGDEETANAYESIKDNFISRNSNLDTYFDFHEYFNLEDFKKKSLSIVDPKNKPAFMDAKIYLLCSFFTFSWLYRRWFEKETVKTDFEFYKVIYLSDLDNK